MTARTRRQLVDRIARDLSNAYELMERRDYRLSRAALERAKRLRSELVATFVQRRSAA